MNAERAPWHLLVCLMFHMCSFILVFVVKRFICVFLHMSVSAIFFSLLFPSVLCCHSVLLLVLFTLPCIH